MVFTPPALDASLGLSFSPRPAVSHLPQRSFESAKCREPWGPCRCTDSAAIRRPWDTAVGEKNPKPKMVIDFESGGGKEASAWFGVWGVCSVSWFVWRFSWWFVVAATRK